MKTFDPPPPFCVLTLLALLGPFASPLTAVAQSPTISYYSFSNPSPGASAAPFRDALMPPIQGWQGHVFKLSQNYPATAPTDSTPWKSFDPTTQPLDYLKAALGYFYQGNLQSSDEESFDPALNKIRNWYNAPWQDFGLNGREFIHGLTRERTSQPFELSKQQSHPWNNYAVGFYNALGGVTIGRVWADHSHPDPSVALMPEGTVAAKLLFTTAPVTEAPYLAGSPQWDAYVYADPNDPAPTQNSPRTILKVRLLQIDIAVKDARVASTSGWVFGTFVYGGGPSGTPGSGWTNVAPVGEMWGNDPGYNGSGPLHETYLNPNVAMPHVGYQGRLNGPVDNKISSCISCHSTSEYSAGVMIPPKNSDPSPWFTNVPAGTPFDAGRQSLDYSLQLSVGISNFDLHNKIINSPTSAIRQQLLEKVRSLEIVPPRDGGSLQ